MLNQWESVYQTILIHRDWAQINMTFEKIQNCDHANKSLNFLRYMLDVNGCSAAQTYVPDVGICILPAACIDDGLEKCERRWRFSVWMRTRLLINRWFMVVPIRWQTFPKKYLIFSLAHAQLNEYLSFLFLWYAVQSVPFPFAKLRSEWLNAQSKYDHASKQYADDMMHVVGRGTFRMCVCVYACRPLYCGIVELAKQSIEMR